MEEAADGEDFIDPIDQPFVVTGDTLDDVQIGYPFGVIPADYSVPERVEVIFIAQVETKVLAAVPFSAWHRLKNQRILPTGSLSKLLWSRWR